MRQAPAHKRRILQAALVAALLACTSAGRAQSAGNDHVEVLNADRWEYDKDKATGAQRLIGNVRLKQKDGLMSCDSAHLYTDDKVGAFGRVLLTQDTVRITGDRLEYDGRARTARMTGHVRLADPGMELTTEDLTYDLRSRRAEYRTGARIQGSRDGNTLTSMIGAYEVGTRTFSFTGQVRISHPERQITSDTLRYNNATGVAEFLGPTHILQEGTVMYGERGSYDTRKEEGRLTRAGRIKSGAQQITGDTLHYRKATGEGAAWGHVTLTDTAGNMLVRGNEGRHNERTGKAMVTGRAELVMAMAADSLFLHADTLFATQDSAGGRRVQARRQVRFFKSDLQGVCDTMDYVQADSLITLRGKPFLWAKEDQLSGDTVRIRLRHGKAETLYVDGTAFMASQADSTHYNQVAGLAMVGHFREDELYKLIVEGNSRTIYFARETKDSVEQVTGMNRADCSIITVGLHEGQVSSVSFLTQPSATLFPLDKVPQGERRLEGFEWNAEARPKDRYDIFREPGTR